MRSCVLPQLFENTRNNTKSVMGFSAKLPSNLFYAQIGGGKRFPGTYLSLRVRFGKRNEPLLRGFPILLLQTIASDAKQN
jgi:hypothetical protein